MSIRDLDHARREIAAKLAVLSMEGRAPNAIRLAKIRLVDEGLAIVLMFKTDTGERLSATLDAAVLLPQSTQDQKAAA